MYRYTQPVGNGVINTQMGKRIMTILLVIFLVISIVMSIMYVRRASFENNTNEQLSQRMLSCWSNALEQANKLTSSVTSETSTRLSIVRQYIFAMDQINQISVSLHGESGRMVPQDAFTALYSDIESYETLTQTATTSTLDARTLLLNHLSSVQVYIVQSD